MNVHQRVALFFVCAASLFCLLSPKYFSSAHAVADLAKNSFTFVDKFSGDIYEFTRNGDYAYVVGSVSPSPTRIYTIDMQDRTNIERVHNGMTEPSNSRLEVAGQYLYVYSPGRLRSYDVTNPVVPTFRNHQSMADISALETNGPLAFVGRARSGAATVDVMDFADASNVHTSSVLDLPSIASLGDVDKVIVDLELLGDTLWVSYQLSKADPAYNLASLGAVAAFDIVSSTLQTLQGIHFGTHIGGQLATYQDIYLFGAENGVISVYNIADPVNPFVIGQVDYGVEIVDLAVGADKLYAVDTDGNIAAFSLENPLEPVVIGYEHGLQSRSPYPNIEADDSYVYVTKGETEFLVLTPPASNPPVTLPAGEDLNQHPFAWMVQHVYDNVTVGQPLGFSGVGSFDYDGSISAFHWEFGDGAISSEITPTHQYAQSGVYYVRLTVTDDAGASTSVELNQPVLVDVASCPDSAENGLLFEQWNNLAGTTVADLINHPSYPDNPDLSETISTFAIETNSADQYGVRLQGYLFPWRSGNIQLRITSDDQGELWLSSDAQPANKQRVAYVDDWAPIDSWDKYIEQTSQVISVEAGKRLYIEALMKEGSGGDHLQIEWRLDDGPFLPIPSSALCQFSSTVPTQIRLHRATADDRVVLPILLIFSGTLAALSVQTIKRRRVRAHGSHCGDARTNSVCQSKRS